MHLKLNHCFITDEKEVEVLFDFFFIQRSHLFIVNLYRKASLFIENITDTEEIQCALHE